MAFQKSFFKGSRLFSSEREQTQTPRSYCSPCFGWEIVTVFVPFPGAGHPDGRECFLHVEAARVDPRELVGRPGSPGRPPPTVVSHLPSPIVIRVPREALHLTSNDKQTAEGRSTGSVAPDRSGTNPGSSSLQLCDFRPATYPFCALVP